MSAAVDAAEIVARLEEPAPTGGRSCGTCARTRRTRRCWQRSPRAERPRPGSCSPTCSGSRRHAAAAPLAAALDDPDEGVRAGGGRRARQGVHGPTIRPAPRWRSASAPRCWRAYEVEPSPAVYRTLASALGAARYRPALAALRAALESDDPSLARMAAWGLHWLEGTPPPAG
jgi:hypothetical protein